MKKTIKKYHLKENVKNKIQEIILTSLIVIFGALAIVGLFAIANARIEKIQNNQNIIGK